MPLVQVVQFLTVEGKVQIDITNTSGRAARAPDPALHSRTNTSFGPEDPSPQQQQQQQRPDDLLDRDEPCSLIVSLRASHPQFFYYRGPQQKPYAPAITVTSPLRAPAGHAGATVAGGDAGHLDAHKHQRGPSTLWGQEVVDPTIEDVARQSWRDYGFLPLADAAALRGTANTRTSAAAHRHNAVGHSDADGGDDRPLLVREALADCVLLPGERRTFLLEVDTPAVLARLTAPLSQQRSRPSGASPSRGVSDLRTGALSARSQLSRHPTTSAAAAGRRRGSSSSGGNSGSHQDDTIVSFSERTRGVTDVFHPDVHESRSTGRPSPALSTTVSPADKRGLNSRAGRRSGDALRSGSRNSSDISSGGSDVGTGADTSTYPRRWSLPFTADGQDGAHKDRREAGRSPAGNTRRTRLWTDWEGRDTAGFDDDDDDDRPAPSRQPLSIVRDSTSTRGSLEAPRPSITAAAAPAALGAGGAPMQRAGGRESRVSSHDYTVPTSTSSTADSTPLAARGARAGGDGQDGHGTPGWSSPTSAPQRIMFYVYFAPLGDEDKCVNAARKWLQKERHAYHVWLDSMVRTVVDLERKRERGWVRRGNNTVASPDPPLGARRVLPPVLGELVRWRGDGGDSGAAADAMTPSPTTAAAFHLYYRAIQPLNVVRRSLSRLSAVNGAREAESRSGREREAAVVEPPPSFAMTRRNRVSKKARKMFNDVRHGAGTVVLPMRVHPQSATNTVTAGGRAAATSAAIRGSAAGSSLFDRANAPPSSSAGASAAASVHPPSHSPHVSEPQRGAEAASAAAAAAAQQQRTCSLEPSFEWAGDERGHSTPTSESRGGADPGRARQRLKSGRGLALLEDSVSSPPTPSRNSLVDGAAAAPLLRSDARGTSSESYLTRHLPSSAGKARRTETLDPAAAERAAIGMSASSASSVLGHYHSSFRERSDSPVRSRPGLTAFLAATDAASPEEPPLFSSSSGGAMGSRGAARHSSVLLGGSASSNLPAALSPDDAAGAATTAAAAVPPPAAAAVRSESLSDGAAGSFVAQLLQSFCARRSGSGSAADEDGSASPHVRDISSAPPQALTYRRRHTISGPTMMNHSFFRHVVPSSSSATNGSGSFAARGQENLMWIADQSRVAGGQVKVAARQLSATAAVAYTTASDLVQQHGPSAVGGLASAVNLLKDVVFTRDNVQMLQAVVTPMVMVCSVVVILYLLLARGGGDTFATLDGGGL
ncbi:hypothetical protein NESM_000833100 [Novymonas esmeraldas]|uniref:Uncharacterized protein n=1 Tax=Novymonas esmeraldas TaxID=1808958 RepID=A0AAW0F0R7_9TRYP